MSNSLAIATVTATLQQLILGEVVQEFPGVAVQFGRPVAPTENTVPTVNIYLYQVGANLGYRNYDQPARLSDGTLTQLSRTGLDLYYLISFYGNEQNLEPQRLLGIVVRTLHTYNLLTSVLIQATKNQPLYSFLANSNLDSEPVEQVKLTPLFANAQGEGLITNLWSTFFNDVPYSLSLAYQASLVVIDGTETVTPAKKVTQSPIINSQLK